MYEAPINLTVKRLVRKKFFYSIYPFGTLCKYTGYSKLHEEWLYDWNLSRDQRIILWLFLLNFGIVRWNKDFTCISPENVNYSNCVANMEPFFLISSFSSNWNAASPISILIDLVTVFISIVIIDGKRSFSGIQQFYLINFT